MGRKGGFLFVSTSWLLDTGACSIQKNTPSVYFTLVPVASPIEVNLSHLIQETIFPLAISFAVRSLAKFKFTDLKSFPRKGLLSWMEIEVPPNYEEL